MKPTLDSADLTVLPLPSEVIYMIYNEYLESVVPGERAFTSSLLLSRALYELRAPKIYSTITLNARNIDSFIRPWKLWFFGTFFNQDEKLAGHSRKQDVPLASAVCPVRRFLAFTTINSLTFQDVFALSQFWNFLSWTAFFPWNLYCISDPRASFEFLATQLPVIAFNAPAFDHSTCMVWLRYLEGSLPHIKARNFHINMPHAGLTTIVNKSLSTLLTAAGSTLGNVLVTNCLSPREFGWCPPRKTVGIYFELPTLIDVSEELRLGQTKADQALSEQDKMILVKRSLAKSCAGYLYRVLSSPAGCRPLIGFCQPHFTVQDFNDVLGDSRLPRLCVRQMAWESGIIDVDLFWKERFGDPVWTRLEMRR